MIIKSNCAQFGLASCRRERNIREIFSMYDVSFAKLSERFFKTTSWPPVHMIADLVDGDHVFCLLYKVQPHDVLMCPLLNLLLNLIFRE